MEHKLQNRHCVGVTSMRYFVKSAQMLNRPIHACIHFVQSKATGIRLLSSHRAVENKYVVVSTWFTFGEIELNSILCWP